MGTNNSFVPWVRLIHMKLNNKNKLPREESFYAFPNGSIFPSPNQLFQTSDSILLLIQKFRSLVFIFEHRKRNVYFPLEFLFFPASKNLPEILCLLEFSSKISRMRSCLLYLNNSLLPIFDIQISQT
jgi:hypothetical protein